jgi:hypothetical protein
MAEYDKLDGSEFVPYAMLAGQADFVSEVVNTDEHGFRYTLLNKKKLSLTQIEAYDSVNILIGGSAVFGVGASSDESTISSLLAEKTGEFWLNLGIRGGVSFHEYIHLIRFIAQAKKINKIVFMSGVNDLYINQISNLSDSFDRQFGEQELRLKMLPFKKMLLARFMRRWLGYVNLDVVDKGVLATLSAILRREEEVKIELSEADKSERFEKNYERNFLLYSALKKELACEMIFCFQPFFYWTDKTMSEVEKQVFNELEAMQEGTPWVKFKRDATPAFYEAKARVLKDIAERRDIKFVDLNRCAFGGDTCFVDAVHLSDEGNLIVSEAIMEVI